MQSQTQMIKSLNHEITLLQPVRKSYLSLSHYHQQLIADTKQVLSEQAHFQKISASQFRDMQSLLSALNVQRTQLEDDLHQAEETLGKAQKDIMHNKVFAEKLGGQIELQTLKRTQLRCQAQDACKDHQSLMSAVANCKAAVEQLRKEIDNKTAHAEHAENEVMDTKDNIAISTARLQAVEAEIRQLRQQNESLQGRCKATMEAVTHIQAQCKTVVTVNHTQRERVIALKEKLHQICNNKEFTLKQMTKQEQTHLKMTTVEKKLENFIGGATANLQATNQEIIQFEESIGEMHQESARLRQNKAALLEHLSSLQAQNELLMRRLEDSCLQDIRVSEIVQFKTQRLRHLASRGPLAGLSSNIAAPSSASKTEQQDFKKTASSWTTGFEMRTRV